MKPILGLDPPSSEVLSMDSLMSTLCMKELVATVMGYQTWTRHVSKYDTTHGTRSSVDSTVKSTFLTGTTVPSGTALILRGSFPFSSLTM